MTESRKGKENERSYSSTYMPLFQLPIVQSILPHRLLGQMGRQRAIASSFRSTQTQPP